MPAERYYLPTPLREHETVTLTDAEFHHLTNVMRGKAGDAVELVNGQGALACGEISAIEKKKAFVTITKVINAQRGAHQITLAQAITRPSRLDFILEKGTELGMDALWLFPGDRSERKELSEHQLERSRVIAIGAMKQSGRLFLPEILLMPRLEKWQKPTCPLFFGDVSPEAPPFKRFWDSPPPPECAFFIGPESGFSPSEEHVLRSWQAHGVHLHNNILRTDTAALAALTLFSHWDAP